LHSLDSEILVEPQDDISTLGDPMFCRGGMLLEGLEKDEWTGTVVGDDYDDTRGFNHVVEDRSTGWIPVR